MIRPNELIIGDHNAAQLMAPVVDGQQTRRGLIPRDYNAYPQGHYAAAPPAQITLIPRSEWSERIKQKVANKSQLSDIRLTGNNGQMIPSRDQNGRGYCWAHSTTSCVIMLRAVMNQPYADLSAYAVACIIKNYRDEGGWGAQSLDFIMQRGIPTSQFWPQQSVSRTNDNAQTWANAALHKVTDGFLDLNAAQYDRNLTFEQEATLLLVNTPVVKDENWWSHSIAGLDLVDGSTQRDTTRVGSGKLATVQEYEVIWGVNDPVTAGYGVRIWNSWGDSWSDRGMGVLTGSKAVSDGAVAPVVTVPGVS